MPRKDGYNIGLAVKYYRELKGYSQRKLAKEVNISNAMISLLERSKRGSVGADIMYEISIVLDVSCDLLMKKAKELGGV